MELGAEIDIHNDIGGDEALFNIMRDPKPDETSRFLSILDSPTNSDGDGRKLSNDFSSAFLDHTSNEPYKTEEIKKTPGFPTKVVLAKNLPINSNELDLYTICGMFGEVKKVLLKPQNTTAYVEFETKQGAQKSVNSSFNPLGPAIDGNRVSFEFTGYDEVFFEDSPTTSTTEDKTKPKENQR